MKNFSDLYATTRLTASPLTMHCEAHGVGEDTVHKKGLPGKVSPLYDTLMSILPEEVGLNKTVYVPSLLSTILDRTLIARPA